MDALPSIRRVAKGILFGATSALVLPAATALAVALGGCGGSRGPAQSPVAMLKSADPDERRDAAHDLRADGGPTPEATRALLEAIQTETDERTYGEMLIALGASGAPEAEPLICAKIYAPDERSRNIAKRALKLYLPRNRSSPGCPPPGTQPAASRTGSSASAPASATSTSTSAPADGVTIGPTH
jgi:hypothetical protein